MSTWSDQLERTVEAQAKHISRLNEDVRRYKDEIQYLKRQHAEDRKFAQFYRQMQEVILDNPTVMSEWQRFCMVLKMAKPEMDSDPSESYYDGGPYA